MLTRNKIKDIGLKLETLTTMSMPKMDMRSNHRTPISELKLCGSKRRGGQ